MARTTAVDPIRVMVVDDSAIIRGLFTRLLEPDSDISVTASAGNGEVAIKSFIHHKDIDVIILDIEMPVMDGLTALPKLLEVDPEVKIVVASTLTKRNSKTSIRALTAGAVDYIPKPSSSREIGDGVEFRRELLENVRTLGDVRRRRLGRGPWRRLAKGTAAPPAASVPISLRQAGSEKPEVLAIGSSTGGPQALFAFFGDLKTTFKLPIIITQHMPSTFTPVLAEHISQAAGWWCNEGKEGDVITSGRILLAPGDFHMLVEPRGANKVIRLNKESPENFCRPSVDPMLRSIAKAYGGRVLVVVLTGMGADGKKGAQTIVRNGGTVIAQDEKTSVVWGMPGAVATAGICSAVLPLDRIASYVMKSASEAA